MQRQREVEQGRTHPVLEWAIRGWKIFEQTALPEAAQLVKELQQDLCPLLNVAGLAPRTLAHGDYKFANLGSIPPPLNGGGVGARTIILDWQDATYGSPLLDLGYFLEIGRAHV